MPSIQPQTRRHFTDAARTAAAAALKAKREGPDRFGQPELFVVKADDHTFTWELRRFGGMVLRRGPEAFCDTASARAEGKAALAALCASPELPQFKQQIDPRTTPISSSDRGGTKL